MNSPVILITGAGKGIGEATVLEIIKRVRLKTFASPRLLLTARTAADLEKIQSACVSAAVDCEILPLELSQAPTQPVELALKKFGRIDTLIHSAGVGRFGSFLDLTLEDFQYVMKTNLEASFSLMQATYRQMKAQGCGDILWVTSVAAEKPFEHSSIYCMSKYAQKGLIDVMRLYAQKDGIRMIEVKPGATLTPMWGEVTDAMKSRMMASSDVASIMLDTLALPRRASVDEILIRPSTGDL